MSDFVLTYKGALVPDHIVTYLIDDCGDLDAFITGVDAGLKLAAQTEPELTTPKLRAFKSGYGTLWFEVEPGWFVAASTRARAEEDYQIYGAGHTYGRSEEDLRGSYSSLTPIVEA